MTKQELAAAADSMIGAAQKLEAAAKRLKEEAKVLRSGQSSVEQMKPEDWMFHKAHDIKYAAKLALVELGAMHAGCWLIDSANISDYRETA